MKNEKGVTLVALMVTIIVLFILLGIGVGSIVGNKGNIKRTQKQVLVSELAQVKQIVLETYIKYRQTQNINYLIGNEVEYVYAQNNLKAIKNDLDLQVNIEDIGEKEKAYYEIGHDELLKLGIKNSRERYIINYFTGEVFNISTQKTQDGDILYDGD